MMLTQAFSSINATQGSVSLRENQSSYRKGSNGIATQNPSSLIRHGECSMPAVLLHTIIHKSIVKCEICIAICVFSFLCITITCDVCIFNGICLFVYLFVIFVWINIFSS